MKLTGDGGVEDILRGCCREAEDDGEGVGGGDGCIICLSGFGDSGRKVVLGCGHGFHEVCLRKWLYRSRQCPTCRREAGKEEEEEEEEGECKKNDSAVC